MGIEYIEGYRVIKTNMTLELWAFGLALGANLLVGAVLVFAVYGLMEQRLILGAVGGLILGAVIVWTQATVGEMLWDLTFEEKRNIIVVAGIGAAVGIVGTMTVFKPEIE
jgi:hypothetical protein